MTMYLVLKGASLFARDIEADGDADLDEVFHPLSDADVEHGIVGWAPRHRAAMDKPMHRNRPDSARAIEHTITRAQYHQGRAL